MNLARVACKYTDFDVTATEPDGDPAPLTGVDVAVVRAGASPDNTTEWTAAQYADGIATVMLAGPHATDPPPAAIVVNEPGGDLWARVADNPEVDAAMLERIILI